MSSERGLEINGRSRPHSAAQTEDVGEIATAAVASSISSRKSTRAQADFSYSDRHAQNIGKSRPSSIGGERAAGGAKSENVPPSVPGELPSAAPRRSPIGGIADGIGGMATDAGRPPSRPSSRLASRPPSMGGGMVVQAPYLPQEYGYGDMGDMVTLSPGPGLPFDGNEFNINAGDHGNDDDDDDGIIVVAPGASRALLADGHISQPQHVAPTNETRETQFPSRQTSRGVPVSIRAVSPVPLSPASITVSQSSFGYGTGPLAEGGTGSGPHSLSPLVPGGGATLVHGGASASGVRGLASSIAAQSGLGFGLGLGLKASRASNASEEPGKGSGRVGVDALRAMLAAQAATQAFALMEYAQAPGPDVASSRRSGLLQPGFASSPRAAAPAQVQQLDSGDSGSGSKQSSPVPGLGPSPGRLLPYIDPRSAHAQFGGVALPHTSPIDDRHGYGPTGAKGQGLGTSPSATVARSPPPSYDDLVDGPCEPEPMLSSHSPPPGYKLRGGGVAGAAARGRGGMSPTAVGSGPRAVRALGRSVVEAGVYEEQSDEQSAQVGGSGRVADVQQARAVARDRIRARLAGDARRGTGAGQKSSSHTTGGPTAGMAGPKGGPLSAPAPTSVRAVDRLLQGAMLTTADGGMVASSRGGSAAGAYGRGEGEGVHTPFTAQAGDGRGMSNEARAHGHASTAADKLAYSSKPRPVHYTPHTLPEFRALKASLGLGGLVGSEGAGSDSVGIKVKNGPPVPGYYELGRLGPDLASEEHIARRAQRERAQAYGQQVKILAAQQSAMRAHAAARARAPPGVLSAGHEYAPAQGGGGYEEGFHSDGDGYGGAGGGYYAPEPLRAHSGGYGPYDDGMADPQEQADHIAGSRANGYGDGAPSPVVAAGEAKFSVMARGAEAVSAAKAKQARAKEYAQRVPKPQGKAPAPASGPAPGPSGLRSKHEGLPPVSSLRRLEDEHERMKGQVEAIRRDMLMM